MQEQEKKYNSFAGHRIRSLRKQRHLSIGDFARQVGVSTGHISLIERNLIEPSLSVLRKISRVLDVGFSMLLIDGFSDSFVIQSDEQARSVTFSDGNITYWFRTPREVPGADPQIFMSSVHIAPRSFDHEERVSHASHEVTYVLKGQVEYHTDQGVYALSEGDCIYITERLPHNVYNPSDQEVELLCMFNLFPISLPNEEMIGF